MARRQKDIRDPRGSCSDHKFEAVVDPLFLSYFR